MALDYTFRIKQENSLLNLVELYLEEHNISYAKENGQAVVHISLYEPLGIGLSIYVSSNINEEEIWEQSSNISFRLDKFYDISQARLNMIDLVFFILKNTKEDCVLSFDGEVILKRKQSDCEIIQNVNFWNTEALKERSKMISAL